MPPPPAAESYPVSDSTYIISELQNHCALLRTILRSSYLRDVITHKDIERATVIRLLTEMDTLIAQLRSQDTISVDLR